MMQIDWVATDFPQSSRRQLRSTGRQRGGDSYLTERFLNGRRRATTTTYYSTAGLGACVEKLDEYDDRLARLRMADDGRLEAELGNRLQTTEKQQAMLMASADKLGEIRTASALGLSAAAVSRRRLQLRD
jgi:hypothetical protein